MIPNIILHFLCVYLLFIILLKLKSDKIHSFFLSVIFAVHPLFLNAVSWIPGRNDTILTLFVLLSFYFFISYLDNKKYLEFILSGLFTLCALLSKETGLLIPLVFSLYYLIKEKKLDKNYIKWFVIWSLVLLIWFVFRSISDLGENINKSGIEVILTNLAVFPEFIAKFFLPYSISVLPVYKVEVTIIGILIIIALLLLPKFTKKFNTQTYFGLVWFFLFALPAVIITTKNSNDWNQYLECRSYLPIAGLLIFLSNFIRNDLFSLSNKRNQLIFLVILAAFITINFIESFNYQNSLNFYESAVKDTPDRALYNEILCNIYMANGFNEKAEQTYLRMTESNPDYSKYFLKLGEFYYNTKQFNKSLEPLKKSYSLDTHNRYALSLLLNSYTQLNMADSSIIVLRRIYKDTINYPEAFIDLLNLLIRQEKFGEATDIAMDRIKSGYDKTIILELYSNWSRQFFEEKNNPVMIKILEETLKIEPENAKIINYLYESYQTAGINDKAEYYLNILKKIYIKKELKKYIEEE